MNRYYVDIADKISYERVVINADSIKDALEKVKEKDLSSHDVSQLYTKIYDKDCNIVYDSTCLFDFIHEYYPNYSSSDEILQSDIYQRFIDNELDEEENSEDLENIKDNIKYGNLEEEIYKLEESLLIESFMAYYDKNCKEKVQKRIQEFIKENNIVVK